MFTIFAPIALIVCTIWLCIIASSQNKKISAIDCILAITLILALTMVRTHRNSDQTHILIPLRTFIDIWNSRWHSHGKYIFRGLIGNILLFTPLGLCLSRKDGNHYKYLTPFLISLVVESIQYFTRLGTFEVDDLICNTIGGLLGYELGKQIGGQRKGNFIIPCVYLAALGVCCLKSILLN